MDAKELLQQVTTDVVIEIMEENGSPVYSRSVDGRTQQEILWFKTICHGGDSAKLAFYTETKDFYCYTSCGRMPFFDLIKRIRGYGDDDFYACLKYVAEKLGINLKHDRDGIQDSKRIKEMNRTIFGDKAICEKKKSRNEYYSPENAPEIKEFYNKNILNYFDKDTFYQGWIDEGINIETMQKYEISYYWLENHIIIPHYNQNNQLVGIRRRSLKPEDAKNKYMPETIEGLTYGHPLGLNFYGLNINQDAIKRQRKAVIVEGEKSVLLGDSYYNDNNIVIATCGFNISQWQIETLTRLGVEQIYLGFDKDFDINKEVEYMQDEVIWNNYLHYKNRLQTLAKRLKNNFTTYVLYDKTNLLGYKDSPLDRGKAVFEELMSKAVLLERPTDERF